MNGFETYVGKRLSLRHTSVEIIRREIRGHHVWFVGRDVIAGQEMLVSLRALQKNLAQGNIHQG